MSVFRYIHMKYGYAGLFVVMAFVCVVFIGILFIVGERIWGFESLEAIVLAFLGLVFGILFMRLLDKIKIRDDVERNTLNRKR